MRRSEIEEQPHHRLFLPLGLRMSDGSLFEVRHPEMLMVSHGSNFECGER